MDSRLEIAEQKRPTPDRPPGDLPLVTIAWRSLRGEYRRGALQRSEIDRERERVARALVAIADQSFRLRRGAADGAAGAAPMLAAAGRLEAALASLEVQVLAPGGQPYGAELSALFENVAQIREAVSRPTVAEVLAPAVIQGDRLLRAGKAVVALPALDIAGDASEGGA